MKVLKKILLISIFLLAISICSKVNAGTSISISPSNPKVGEEVTVTVTVSGVTNADVHVNVSGAGVSGIVQVVNSSTDGNNTSFSSSKTFTPTSAGQITAKTTDSSNAVEYDGKK